MVDVIAGRSLMVDMIRYPRIIVEAGQYYSAFGCCLIAVTLATSSFTCRSAQAGTTTIDAKQAVTDLLKAYGPVPLTQHNYYQCNCTSIGRGCYGDPGPCRTVCYTCDNPKVINGILNARNIRVVTYSSVAFDTPPEKKELPDQFVSSAFIYQNCSTKVKITDTETTSVSFQRGTSTSVTNTVSDTTGFSGQAQWKLSDSLQLTFGVTVSNTNTTAVAKMDSISETVARSHVMSAEIPPGVAFGSGVKTWPVNYLTHFHATVTVEADLSANDKGLVLLSQVADAAHRTFEVAGTIGFTDAADGLGLDWDVEYDQSRCPSNYEGVVKTPTTLPSPGHAIVKEWQLKAGSVLTDE